MIPFIDRREAGRILAGYLGEYAGRNDMVVLALPRGGVPVGFEIAKALHAPLDVLTIRKLGAPWNPEISFGVIGTDDLKLIDKAMVNNLGVSDTEVEYVAAREQAELRKAEQTFRSAHPLPPLKGKTVIVVDDGLSTGLIMSLAIEVLRKREPARIIGASPVVSNEAWAKLALVADSSICVINPSPFYGVGMWYTDFNEISDREIVWHLDTAAQLLSTPKVANL